MAVDAMQIQTTVGRPLTTIEFAQAEMWIDDARGIISHGRDGHTPIDLGLLDQATLDRIVREAVAARIKRPEPVTEVSVQIDDGQVSKKYESGTGQITIFDYWWDQLLPAAAGRAFTILCPVIQPCWPRHDW